MGRKKIDKNKTTKMEKVEKKKYTRKLRSQIGKKKTKRRRQPTRRQRALGQITDIFAGRGDNRIQVDLSRLHINRFLRDVRRQYGELPSSENVFAISFDGTHFITINNNISWEDMLDAMLEEEVEGISDSLQNVAQRFIEARNLIVRRYNNLQELNQVRNRRVSGAFFKYYSKIKYDLSDLQIYNKNKLPQEIEQCLIKSFMESDFENKKEVVNYLSYVVRDNIIPKDRITEIVKKYNLTIKIYVLRKGNEKIYDTEILGNKDKPIDITIGNAYGHYFVIKDYPISKFSLKHYEKVKKYKDWNLIIRFVNSNNKEYPVYDKEVKLPSHILIKNLVEYGLVEPIKLNDEIMKTALYKKVEKEIDLSKIFKKNTQKPISKKEKWDNMDEEKLEEIDLSNKPLIFFDTEATTEDKLATILIKKFGNNIASNIMECLGVENKHKPYLLCYKENKDKTIKTIKGEKCGLYFLCDLRKRFKNQKVLIVAHNLRYDLSFVFNYLSYVKNVINKNGSILYMNAVFGSVKKNNFVEIIFKDSYSFISTKLSKFSEMFNIESYKELMPYEAYNELTIDKKEMELKEYLSYYDTNKEREEFLENLQDIEKKTKKKFINGKMIKHIDYSEYYCKKDIEVLCQGFNAMRNNILDNFGIDIINQITISGTADEYAKIKGWYDGCYEISGIMREFIGEASWGGRCMSANNEMIYVIGKIGDEDVNSLYPYGVYGCYETDGGYIKGEPKKIPKQFLKWEWIKKQDYYFIKINVRKINIKRRFPILSYVNEEGIRMFTNDETKLQGLIVGKYDLEDAIEFQGIEFEILEGLYFNEGFNPNCKEILDIYNKRREYKAQGNPIQNQYKTMMNSIYGKNLLKPIEYENRIVNGEKTLNDFLIRNKNWVHSFNIVKEENENKNHNIYDVKLRKPIQEHFNRCHIGAQILSMSRRHMNRILSLAEDNGIECYYTDTDSVHLNMDKRDLLGKVYKEKYGKDLYGKGLGQMSSDFEGDSYSKKLIVLGKKKYYDRIVDGKGDLIKPHYRAKGIPLDSVERYCDYHGLTIEELYEKRYNRSLEGKEGYEIDIARFSKMGKRFSRNGDYSMSSIFRFPRTF